MYNKKWIEVGFLLAPPVFDPCLPLVLGFFENLRLPEAEALKCAPCHSLWRPGPAASVWQLVDSSHFFRVSSGFHLGFLYHWWWWWGRWWGWWWSWCWWWWWWWRWWEGWGWGRLSLPSSYIIIISALRRGWPSTASWRIHERALSIETLELIDIESHGKTTIYFTMVVEHLNSCVSESTQLQVGALASDAANYHWL